MTESDLPDAWDGIVALYSQQGVAEMCLHWQQQVDLDVPLFLFVVHAARHGYRIENLDALKDWVGDWRAEVVVPLRDARTFLKSRLMIDGVPELRNRIKAEELQAEKIQIEEMARRARLQPADSNNAVLEFMLGNGIDKEHFRFFLKYLNSS